jgi:hypothetical protein
MVFQVKGIRELEQNLRQMAKAAPEASARAVYVWAEEVMAKSKELVPVDSGTLRGTGHVDLPVIGPTEVSVRLGYGGPAAPYALAVHENPRSGKTGGFSPSGRPYRHYARVGQWKYLEQPLKEGTLPPKALAVWKQGLVSRAGLRTMQARAARA